MASGPGNPPHVTTWVSHAAAAELVGCSVHAIESHLDEIRHRPHHGGRPSIDLDSARAWADRWRPNKPPPRPPRPEPADESPPDDRDVWLDTTTAGIVLGCTPVYVARLADQGRIPAVRRGRRWWIRRIDVEQRAAARAFRATHRAA